MWLTTLDCMQDGGWSGGDAASELAQWFMVESSDGQMIDSIYPRHESRMTRALRF